ncbi:hypothetical protein BT96DRAFT_589957 [Gymnopus androsaceus JB14]|uniref:Uncharacterized protein n=1 Tax=Gymnopus androsaceus JB14 TaxID=1447944 RepID=A0A6A4IFH6_9AGAR|nr:hypothetical protein BT96DRAFT_589957 [Gymnopus androsaceus JB14]
MFTCCCCICLMLGRISEIRTLKHHLQLNREPRGRVQMTVRRSCGPRVDKPQKS